MEAQEQSGATSSAQERKRPGRKPRHDAKHAQINIRMDPSLKAAGDVVLERLGISPSEAVRSLYEYLSREQDLPQELLRSPKAPEQPSWAFQNAGLVWKLHSEETGRTKEVRAVFREGPSGYDELLNFTREERYQRYVSRQQEQGEE